MRTRDEFHRAYMALEARMRALAEADGDVFLPNHEPQGPVDYVLICMEPSLGRWARTADDAKRRVDDGFRNFMFSIEDFILHFSVRQYLCRPDQMYHVTDLSKGAMLVNLASVARRERYDRWFDLLQQEVDLISTEHTRFIAVGKLVSQQLTRRGFARPFTEVMHYSGQAGRARSTFVADRKSSFESFRTSVTSADLIATANDVLAEAGIAARMRDETLARLSNAPLSDSRLQLIFHYKIAFELSGSP